MSKRTLAFMMFVLFVLTVMTGGCGGGGSSSSRTEERIDDDPIKVDPIDPPEGEVLEEMRNADFWIDRISNPDKVLADAEKITAINKAIVATEGTSMVNLEQVEEILSADFTAFWTDVYLNGTLFDDDELMAQFEENRITLPEWKYAVTVRKTVVKMWPMEGVVTFEPGNDAGYDILYEATLSVNSPVIITEEYEDEEKHYYFCQTEYCSGWVVAEDLAICSSKDEWIESWKVAVGNAHFVVVTENQIWTETHPNDPEAEIELTMGTVLKLVPTGIASATTVEELEPARLAVYVPTRDEDGKYVKEYALVPVDGVKIGYLPFTQANVVQVACELIDEEFSTYMSISEIVRRVYACFGFKLPLNGFFVSMSDFYHQVEEGKQKEEAMHLGEEVTVGTICDFVVSNLLYLGTYNGVPYGIFGAGKGFYDESAEGITNITFGIVPVNKDLDEGYTLFDFFIGYTDLSQF